MARMTRILYQDQREGNLPKLNAADFVKLIENRDPKLQGFFDILFRAMNPKGKNQKTQESLKQKVMILCYQMAGLRNKQVSGTKSAIGLFLVESGTSTHCVNTVAKMGFSTTYQTAFNGLDKIENAHQAGVQNYIQKFVRLINITIFYLKELNCNIFFKETLIKILINIKLKI